MILITARMRCTTGNIFLKPQVNRKKNYQGKREEAAKSGETVSVGVQCSSKW